MLFYLQCYIYLVTLFCISGEILCNIFSRLWWRYVLGFSNLGEIWFFSIFFFFLGGGRGGPEAPLMFYIYAIICGGFLIGGCVSFSCCVMGVGRAERFIFGSTWFLPVYGQYSREANFCDSLQLVTELLFITLMLLYLWLLQLLVTLFLNNR